MCERNIAETTSEIALWMKKTKDIELEMLNVDSMADSIEGDISELRARGHKLDAIDPSSMGGGNAFSRLKQSLGRREEEMMEQREYEEQGDGRIGRDVEDDARDIENDIEESSDSEDEEEDDNQSSDGKEDSDGSDEDVEIDDENEEDDTKEDSDEDDSDEESSEESESEEDSEEDEDESESESD